MKNKLTKEKLDIPYSILTISETIIQCNSTFLSYIETSAIWICLIGILEIIIKLS